MNIKDYITKEIGTFVSTDTVKKAQDLCQSIPVSHLFVVEEGKLIGCLSENDIRSIDEVEDELQKHSYLYTRFYANEKQTVLELLSLFSDKNCSVIPVLDDKQNYLGYYDLADILDIFSSIPFLKSDSETLVVSNQNNKFSLSQVTQIVESNNAKILAVYISKETSDYTEVTIKIVSNQVNEVIQTFRRYQYTIITEHIEDEYLEELKNRADYFKKFLSI